MAASRGLYNTDLLFRNHALAPLNFNGNIHDTNFSAVNPIYATFFRGYSVHQWTEFEANAAQILAGRQSVTLSREDFEYIKMSFSSGISKQGSEGGVATTHYLRIFGPCNSLPYCDGYQWRNHVHLGHHRTCDFALMTDDVARGDQEGPEVVVKLKRPVVALQLGPDLTTEQLQVRLSSSSLEEHGSMYPFLLLFSYMLDSRKGFGVLSTFEYARFFRLDIRQRKVYMSEAVRHDQKRKENRPHVVQAYLYMYSLEVNENEFRRSEARQKLTEIRKRVGREMQNEREAGTAGSASQKARSGGDIVQTGPLTRSQARARARIPAASASEIYLCAEHLGSLGKGYAGEIMECLHEGMHLAVKMAYPFRMGRDKEDKMEHVRNEIGIYALLSELQGSIVPRVIAAEYGDDGYVTCGGAMLIMEKVGEARLRKLENGLYAGERLLRAEEASEIFQKAMAGLDAIHELDVVHWDVAFRNIRVSVEGVTKVWWIDFGWSVESDLEDVKRDERQLLRDMFKPFLS